MKHATTLIALLTAGSLTTGCGACDPASTLIDWTFTDAAGTTTTSCSAAGVATFRIFVNDQPQLDQGGTRQDLPCAEYASGAQFPTQTTNDRLQVEAYDANGNLLYLLQSQVATRSCGVTRYHASLVAQQGTLTVNLAGFAQCPVGSKLWYSLTNVTDPAHPSVYSVIDGLSLDADKASIPCQPSLQFDAVPFGTYRLDFIQVVHLPPGASNYVADFEACSPQAINPQTVTHSANETITATLAPATGACGQ